MALAHDQDRCLTNLIWATKQLQGNADLDQLSKIADLIIQTMTGPWRFFHTPEHIFEVGGEVTESKVADPIEVLAALFHDLVYVQVDQGVSVNISRYISPFVKEKSDYLMILEKPELPSDRMFELVTSIFGFSAGQALAPPTVGHNEFLSAVIAVKALEDLLPQAVLAEIAACIELTIPFRPKSDTEGASDRLYTRIVQTNQRFELGWSDEKLVDVVRRAVRVANRDVENFASPNSAHFLGNTWNLLPETNHHLTNANSYTVQGYRTSIQKMEGFMNFLKPELVFQQFHQEPDDETYYRLLEQTRRNLEIAKLYLGIKLVSIAIIEALSFRIGRDIPISTMMGELPSTAHHAAQLEHFIPEIPPYYPPQSDLEKEVLDLLEKGRELESSYDVKNSPIATFVVKSVGFDDVKILIDRAKRFFKEQISAEEFLASCKSEVVATVTHSILELFERRKIALSHPDPAIDQ